MAFLLALLLLSALPPSRLPAQVGSGEVAASYWVYVANESSDIVSRVRFGPDGAVEEKAIPVGIMPADLDGVHGISVSPDGRHWYLTLAHGTPFGKVWQFRTGTDDLVDSASAGLFPATLALSPDGSLLFASNFNLHGNPVPSTVSVFFTRGMREMAEITTCTQPHGGRVNHAGTRHYSACVMDDQVIEIATDRLAVSRRLSVRRGHEGPVESAAREGPPTCKPTWAAPSPDDRYVYVPCNAAAVVLEINAETWEIDGRFPTGRGPYNAAVTPDGRFLVVTLKGDQAVAIIDRASGEQRRVRTSQPLTHGVALSPDSRYAFVSNEAIGATRGTLDVIDLASGARVASVALRLQPGGIAFWKMEVP